MAEFMKARIPEMGMSGYETPGTLWFLVLEDPVS
jgi:hypothetical protein